MPKLLCLEDKFFFLTGNNNAILFIKGKELF